MADDLRQIREVAKKGMIYMAFYPQREDKTLTEKQFKEVFNEYCNWCWGHGYGSCDECEERKNKYIDDNYKKVAK